MGPEMKPKILRCYAGQRELLEVENWIYKLESYIRQDAAHRGVDTPDELEQVAYAASPLEGDAALSWYAVTRASPPPSWPTSQELSDGSSSNLTQT